MRPKKYFCRTFRQNIWYFIGWPREKFEEYVEKKMGVLVELGVCYGACLNIPTEDDSLILVWVGDKKRVDIVTHESIHAANYILEMIGHIPSQANDEVQAYLTQEIFSEAIG